MAETPYQKRDRLLKKRAEEQTFRLKRAAEETFNVVMKQVDPYKYNRDLFKQKESK